MILLGQELDDLRVEAERLEPHVRDLCIRAEDAMGRYHKPYDLPDDDPAVRLHSTLCDLGAHIRGAIESIPSLPDWAEPTHGRRR